MKRCKISNNVIRRLPRYLRKLDELQARGVARVSSSLLGEELGLTSSQIRQDFSCFGEFGQQGYGYHVATLRGQIAAILGLDRGYEVILVGVGNMGKALLCNFDFASWGFRLASAFDVNPLRIGEDYSGIPVQSMDRLEDYLRQHPTDAAVLTVPREAAVATAERLLACGVKAIWNFTNVELPNPEGAIIENMHFSDSLLALGYFLANGSAMGEENS